MALRTAYAWLALGMLGQTSPGFGAPEIPPDAQRCMAEKKLWLAAPRFVESIEVAGPTPRKAYQIHDRLEGADGHILVYPDTCRVVVLVLQPAPRDRPLERSFFVSAPPGAPATKEENLLLRKWIGLRPLSEDDPRLSLSQISITAWENAATRTDDLLVRHRRRRVNLRWRTTDSRPLVPTALATENRAIEKLLSLDALVRRSEGLALRADPIGPEVEVHIAPGTSALALRLVDQQRSAWLGVFDLGAFDGDVHQVGTWLWMLTGTRLAPELLAINVQNGEQYQLGLQTRGQRVRASLTPRGLTFGAVDEPGRTVPWTELCARLGPINSRCAEACASVAAGPPRIDQDPCPAPTPSR